ncbi:MAG: hypothetical protein KDC31_13265, partial [Saprospiraceae bacterium]|nr:hypothetical protein [Saprospiraceae bacterium]
NNIKKNKNKINNKKKKINIKKKIKIIKYFITTQISDNHFITQSYQKYLISFINFYKSNVTILYFC